MPVRPRVLAAVLAPAAALATLAATPVPAPDRYAVTRPAEVAGLYRMDVPDRLRPTGRMRFPATEVTLLRLAPDGASRLENVTVADRSGAATASVEVGRPHRTPWDVRVPAVGGRPVPQLAELCFESAGQTACRRYERDEVTGDLALYGGASPSDLVLRLERVR